MSADRPDLLSERALWRRGTLASVALATAVSTSACVPPEPYVRYQGNVYQRSPKPPADMEVFRQEPPPTSRFEDLGTVVVTCPSEGQSYGSGSVTQVGGCSYEWAISSAKQRAAGVGADGVHSISYAANAAGAVVSLSASVFVYLPQRVVAPAAPEAPAAPPEATVEERLKVLEKLRADQLITPEEYAKKRSEILGDI